MYAARKLTTEDRQAMAEAVAGLQKTSDRIRALAARGYPRARIAEFLGIRYQHVRNVLEAPKPPSAAGSPPSSSTEASEPFGTCSVEADGRIALPAAVLARLRAKPGSTLPWLFEDDKLSILGPAAGLEFAQRLAAQKTPRPAVSLVQDLRKERREEFRREDTGARDG